MIKIEFKEPREILQDKLWPIVKFVTAYRFDLLDSYGSFRLGFDTGINWDFRWLNEVKSITDHEIQTDPYLYRSFILQQLGISKEQDDEMQQKYKIDESKIIIRKPIMGRYP